MAAHKDLLVKLLAERKTAGLLRETKRVDELIDFCSNDYLGLARDADLAENLDWSFVQWRAEQAPQAQINGSTGSRLISGHSALIQSFEEQAANMHLAEAALFFSSGYEANIGLIAALAQKDHVIFCDKLLHASLIDGLRLSPAERRIFKHNQVADLIHLLEQYPHETTKWVVVESIYSMDGDIAPLAELVQLKERYNLEIIVDEAHAGGMYGPKGAGLVASLGLEHEIFARIITCGKAWGNAGALVLGSAVLKEYLINFARPFIYSTAPTPQHINNLMGVMQAVQQADAARETLKEIIHFFESNRTHPAWGDSKTAIQTFFVQGNEAVRLLAKQVQDAGFAVKPIVYPTVAKGQERIRITLSALTKQADMLRLIQLLETYA